jgi:DHA1 family multidrug resistance protein-like MFS transporter
VGRAVSFTSAAYSFGGIIGPVIGGVVGEAFQLRTAYYLAGIIFTISTIIVMFANKQPAAHKQSRSEGEVHLLKNKTFLGMLLLIFIVMFAVTLPQPMAANFLQNQRGLSLSRIGQLGSIAALGSVILMLVFGHAKTGTAMMIGQAGMMIFSLLIWRSKKLFLYSIGYFFMGGNKLSRAMTVALVQPVIQACEVGLAFGMVETLNALAFMAAPLAAGALYNWHPAAIFSVGLIVLGVSFLLSFFFANRDDKVDKNDKQVPSMELDDES